MTEKEKKERKNALQARQTEKTILGFIENYIDENFNKIQYNDVHETVLKYYKNDKKNFKTHFHALFGNDILLQLITTNDIKFPLTSFPTQCWNCGQYVKLTIDENHVISSTTKECFNEKVFSFDIKIPSGKILFCDWPHLGNEILDIEDEDINCLYGRYLQSKNFAEKFVMHFYVGNTCPPISQKGNEILVEYPGWNEDDEELRYGNGFEHKGNICTDLWWVTGIDLEFYKRLLVRKFGEDILNNKEVKDCIEDAVVLDVEPGTYKCTTFYETCNRDDRSKPQIFVKIEKN